MVGVAIALLLAIFIGKVRRTGRDVLGWLTLALLVIGALNIVWVYLRWWAEDYAVTNRRILKVEGLFNKRAADSSLEKINDAILEQSVFGRMFDWGDLKVLTAAEETADDYHMLHHAPTFKKTMLLAKQDIEDELGPPHHRAARGAQRPRSRAGPARPPSPRAGRAAAAPVVAPPPPRRSQPTTEEKLRAASPRSATPG